VQEKTSWGRNTRACYNGHCFPYEPVNNSEGLGIGKDKEHECGIETVFDLEKQPIHTEACTDGFAVLIAHLVYLAIYSFCLF
jgi:hypothetical protein